MSEVIFVDNDIPQIYGDFKGWRWWDNELNCWSRDEEKYWKMVNRSTK